MYVSLHVQKLSWLLLATRQNERNEASAVQPTMLWVVYDRLCSYMYIRSICIMSIRGVSDLSRVLRARSARGRVDKSGTPQIDMIQMACIPNLLGRRIRIFTATIDTPTP